MTESLIYCLNRFRRKVKDSSSKLKGFSRRVAGWHRNVLLKLNCYYQISIDGEVNPSPERIVEDVMERSVQIRADEAMILSEPDELHMTVYNPDEKLMKLITVI